MGQVKDGFYLMRYRSLFNERPVAVVTMPFRQNGEILQWVRGYNVNCDLAGLLEEGELTPLIPATPELVTHLTTLLIRAESQYQSFVEGMGDSYQAEPQADIEWLRGLLSTLSQEGNARC